MMKDKKNRTKVASHDLTDFKIDLAKVEGGRQAQYLYELYHSLPGSPAPGSVPKPLPIEKSEKFSKKQAKRPWCWDFQSR